MEENAECYNGLVLREVRKDFEYQAAVSAEGTWKHLLKQSISITETG